MLIFTAGGDELRRAHRISGENGLITAAYVRAMFGTRHDAANREVFQMISIPCLGLWATVGSRVGPVVQSGTVAGAFNLLLGAALLASAWVGILGHA